MTEPVTIINHQAWKMIFLQVMLTPLPNRLCSACCRCRRASSSRCPALARSSRCLRRSFPLWSSTSQTFCLKVGFRSWKGNGRAEAWSDLGVWRSRSSGVHPVWKAGRGRVHRLFHRACFQLRRFQILLQDVLGSGASPFGWLPTHYLQSYIDWKRLVLRGFR